MNKLIEEKRYDDVLKVFEHGAQRGFSTANKRQFPSDVVMLAMEGLYRQVKPFRVFLSRKKPFSVFQNTKESLAKAKELISKVRDRDADINPRTAGMTALLGDPAFAMEILGAVRAQNLATVQNIRVKIEEI